MFSYLPHRSSSPYELLAIAILRQAYLDIYNYFRLGEPSDHEGKEALLWIDKGSETLDAVVQAIQLISVKKGWAFGYDQDDIKKNLRNRVDAFKSMAINGEKEKADEIFKAWQLMAP